MSRVFSTEELMVGLAESEPEEREEPQPEGVIIAEVVEGMWLRELEQEYSAADERRAIAAGQAKVKAEAFDEVLREIFNRYGYAPRIWEERVLCHR